MLREALIGSAVGVAIVAAVGWATYPVWREREIERHVDDIKQRGK